MNTKDEWTQEEFYKQKKQLEKQGKQVVLVDTILKPIQGVQTVKYNPFELQQYPLGTVFVFYCDTGKTTKERINFFRSKLPGYECVSLKGGRGYWRPFFQEDIDENI
jgi:hypothetical protein